jgi:hypothetical protein
MNTAKFAVELQLASVFGSLSWEISIMPTAKATTAGSYIFYLLFAAFGFWLSAFGFRLSAFGVRLSAFGFRLSAFGSRCYWII